MCVCVCVCSFVCLFVCLLCVCVCVCFRLIPESVRWLLTHHQAEQAEATLARAAKINKKELPEKHLNRPDDPGKPKEQAGFVDLFRSRSMAKKTFISWFSW